MVRPISVRTSTGKFPALCANRAGSYTLATENTFGVGERLLAGRHDNGFETTASAGENSNSLDFVTSGFTPTAHDTFIHVPGNRFIGQIQFVRALFTFIKKPVQVQLIR